MYVFPFTHIYPAPLIHYLLDYWDSYWIVQGLIKSELFDTVKDTLENFMDELENFGFIPNGGRIYCEEHGTTMTSTRRLTCPS